jgi:hypothetical protein
MDNGSPLYMLIIALVAAFVSAAYVSVGLYNIILGSSILSGILNLGLSIFWFCLFIVGILIYIRDTSS